LAAGFLRPGQSDDIIDGILAQGFAELKNSNPDYYPEVFIIMGNDDPRIDEKLLLDYDEQGLWHYINQKHYKFKDMDVFGYCYVPPTPFLLKDWERYDVSRFVDVGCVAPEEGQHTTSYSLSEVEHRTIWEDLLELTDGFDLSKAILLFHAPPYQTGLDRAALDGKMVDHVPLDVHVGSIAIKRFIEEKQPLITLHGHIHESFSITGVWKEQIANTTCLSAAGIGKPLTLVKFDPDNPTAATRLELL
ncbi:MAG: hypothetical protein R6V77_04665, partial [Candidatus Cloacimonadaceae bacterium]